jgi:Fe-S-cluster containining protein
MISQFNPVIQQAYRIFEEINFSECNGCSECCYFSWLLKEEYKPHLDNFGKAVKNIGSVAFIENCKYAKGNRCDIYEDRPLDCRLFPLDIIEEDGKYWWCVFTICPKHKEIREKLIPLIPKLEAVITPNMFEQYKRQIALTKEIYPPCRLKQYEKIRKFQSKPYST